MPPTDKLLKATVSHEDYTTTKHTRVIKSKSQPRCAT